MVPSSRVNNDDWMTKIVTLETVRPQGAAAIKLDKSIVLLDGLVEVQPHPSLQAKVSLTNVPQASRDLGNLILPPILREAPGVTQSFQFTNSRASSPGLSALELRDVENHTVVTKEASLKLLIDAKLHEGEHLLPFGYDGEFFLPLGRQTLEERRHTDCQSYQSWQPSFRPEF